MIDVQMTVASSFWDNAHAKGRTDVLYGLSHWPTVCSVVTTLAAFPATLPDAYGGILVTT